MLNKVTFSSKEHNQYVSQGLKVAGLAAIGAGSGFAHSALSKDKFNKEKENIITKHFKEIEEEVQDYIEYRKRSGAPLWDEEIDDLRKEYISDNHYRKKLNEALDKFKKNVSKHKKLSAGIGLIAGSLIGTVWVLADRRKNKNDIMGTNLDSNMQSSTKLTVLSPNAANINQKDNNKSIKDIVLVIKSSLAGTAAGILYYLGVNQIKINKEKNNILTKYNEIIEKKISDIIEVRHSVGEIVTNDEKESLKKVFTRRQQKNIDAELTPLKNRAKQCLKKNSSVGLLIGTALGGAYILFKKYNKK